MTATIDPPDTHANTPSHLGIGVPPYAPSWMNRLITWIERLPGPAWLFYLVLYCGLAAILLVIAWYIGIIFIPASVVHLAAYGFYPIYFVALTHYLDRQAEAALARFRPALTMSEVEYQRLAYALTTIPARAAWWITPPAAAIGYMIGANNPDPYSHSGTLIGIATAISSTVFTTVCLGLFIYHTIGQLVMVSRIHGHAEHINPFYAGPLYAFSDLTARTGIGLLFFAYFVILMGGSSRHILLTYVVIGVMILVAISAFVLPLLGIHQRLVQEKARLQAEINHGINIAQEELQQRVIARNFGDMGDLDKVLANLLSLREVAARLSTWPWQVETLRGFVSALLLPILIWILTTMLERFLTI